MKAEKIIPHTRNAVGKLLSGICLFSDGKEWKFIRSQHTGKFFFVIDSGIVSQWSVENCTRAINPPKRITALKEKLAEENEL